MLNKAIKLDRDCIYPLQLASEVTGLSGATLRRAIKLSQLLATKRGAVWYIQGAELQRWLTATDGQPNETGGKKLVVS